MENAGITIEPLNASKAMPPAPPKDDTLSPHLISLVQDLALQEIGPASEKAFKYAETIKKAMMSDFADQLEKTAKQYEMPEPQVMAVKIDKNTTKKLKSEAVPFLGEMIIAAKTGLNTLLVGPAGCGKTFAGEQLAAALDLPYSHLCFTAGASETWLFGRQLPTGFHEGTFSQRYREGGVFLGDELDAADANLLLTINTALANGKLFNPMNGETYTRHKDFVFVGAANTIGKGANAQYTGRNRLDAATLDRFITIEVDYNESIERKLTANHDFTRLLQKVRKALKKADSSEVISTRKIIQCHTMLLNGIKQSKVEAMLLFPWEDDAVKIFKEAKKHDKEKEMEQENAPF